MPAPAPPSPERPRTRPPAFTIASWIVPALGGLVTYMMYQKALERRVAGDWLPGLGQLLAGVIVTAVVTFGCGLTAFLRREENRWMAILPFLTALGILLYFGLNFLRNTLGSH